MFEKRLGRLKNRMFSVILFITILFFNTYNVYVNALDFGKVPLNVASSLIVGPTPNILTIIWDKICGVFEDIRQSVIKLKYKGFKESSEIVNGLKKIAEDEFEIKIYGQEKAKKQMLRALIGMIAGPGCINQNSKEMDYSGGNVVYLIGPPGTGKTKMCLAIANAVLKHPQKTLFFCQSESITDEEDLGSQLFKSVLTGDIGKNRLDNPLVGNGIIPKYEESPLLKHILAWNESVVIIDEYEKMKQKTLKYNLYKDINEDGFNHNFNKRDTKYSNADKILQSIARSGKYKFMNKEIDCRKVLFLVTIDEPIQNCEKGLGCLELKENGLNENNVIEFEHLSMEASREIINDLISDVENKLTDKNGPFRFESVLFDDKSVELMAQYVFNDKILQAKSKNKLESKIYDLFADSIGEEHKKVRVTFVPYVGEREMPFKKTFLDC